MRQSHLKISHRFDKLIIYNLYDVNEKKSEMK